MLPTEHFLVYVYADDVMVFVWMLIVKGANLKNLPLGYLGWFYRQKAFYGYFLLTLEHNCFVVYSKVVNDTSKCLGSVKTYNYNILYQGQM